MCPTLADGISWVIPSTMPSPARRIGTRVSFLPGDLPAGGSLQRCLDLHGSGGQILGDLIGHECRDLAHQLLEVTGAGVRVTQDGKFVLDEGMGEDSEVARTAVKAWAKYVRGGGRCHPESAESWLLCPGGHLSYISPPYGQVAQLVEQRTENPRVGGSIPSLAIRCTHRRQPQGSSNKPWLTKARVFHSL